MTKAEEMRLLTKVNKDKEYLEILDALRDRANDGYFFATRRINHPDVTVPLLEKEGFKVKNRYLNSYEVRW